MWKLVVGVVLLLAVVAAAADPARKMERRGRIAEAMFSRAGGVHFTEPHAPTPAPPGAKLRHRCVHHRVAARQQLEKLPAPAPAPDAARKRAARSAVTPQGLRVTFDVSRFGSADPTLGCQRAGGESRDCSLSPQPS